MLDELDQACKKADGFVKELFATAKLSGSRLIVIGIANRMDLAERVFTDSSKGSAMPSVIAFHSYTARQLLDLLKVCPAHCSTALLSHRSTDLKHKLQHRVHTPIHALHMSVASNF